MFEDEEDDFELSEFEEWFDDNFAYFRRPEETVSKPTLEIELFYDAVYIPIMQELNKDLRTLIVQHYPRIATEYRPEVLEDIDWRIGRTGHKFLLLLYRVVQNQIEGINLRVEYPDLDKWAISYPSYRKPHYLDISFFDKFTWLTNEQKQELIEEDRKEADEIYAIKEKPRFEFFAVVQKSITRYFKEILDLDTDGWTMYNVLLFEEYTDYQLRFEHIDGFIEYEFGIEDLHIPYEEYSKKYSEKWKIQFDKRFNEQNDCNNESID